MGAESLRTNQLPGLTTMTEFVPLIFSTVGLLAVFLFFTVAEG
jgi:hypothetical protein